MITTPDIYKTTSSETERCEKFFESFRKDLINEVEQIKSDAYQEGFRKGVSDGRSAREVVFRIVEAAVRYVSRSNARDDHVLKYSAESTLWDAVGEYNILTDSLYDEAFGDDHQSTTKE